MPEIQVEIQGKIAQVRGNPQIVCGNSDYTAVFDFDSEWDAYDLKTARFVWLNGGQPVYADVLFSGTSAAIPAVYDTYALMIGVYAGDIHTTTAARVPCVPCITGEASEHPAPPPDIYEQISAFIEAQEQGSPVSGAVNASAPEAQDTAAECVSGNAVFETLEEA